MSEHHKIVEPETMKLRAIVAKPHRAAGLAAVDLVFDNNTISVWMEFPERRKLMILTDAEKRFAEPPADA